MTKFEFEAIGTHWQIDIQNNLSKEREVVLLQKINDRIVKFDLDYSRFREDSLVTKMSKESGEFELSEDADLMMMLYKKMYDVTSGLVTPLIGQVLVDAGYDANYSLSPKHLTKPKTWDEVIKWESPKLTLSEPVVLDFGAGGKGYLVDIVSEIIEGEGVQSYCVDAGGDMRQKNVTGEKLKVGLEHPDDSTMVIGTIDILNQSLCGSAGNRRKWRNFHHVISPETLSSPKDILAVWTLADTTILADILTTGLFFVTPETLAKHFDFQYLIIYSDYSMKKSVGFNAEIFTS
ncbi:MAG: thiamine biosynthesis lipoprotein [Parcubacteria bacterium C7867-006]|nr:MAG: thiamine biosynthesis lipoprotein [Parcubacteria bacterium C7867-006]